MRFVREEDLLKVIITAMIQQKGSKDSLQRNSLHLLQKSLGHSSSDWQWLEEILTDIDYIKVSQNDVSVVWKETSQLAEGF